MARFARVTISIGPYVAHGKSVQLNILGTPVNFISTRSTYEAPSGYKIENDCYFAQNTTPDALTNDIGQNVAWLEAAIRNYLQFIGETRYLVSSSIRRSSFGFQEGGSITIKAVDYLDELNLSYVLRSSGDNYLTVTSTTNDSPQTATYLKTDVSCYGAASGDIFLNVNGGVAPYHFKWEDGPATQNREMVTEGVYRVVITDSARPLPLDPNFPPDSPFQTFSEDHPGVVTFEITIGEPTRIEVESTLIGQSVTVRVTGGKPDYTYYWNDGTTQKDRSDLSPGRHQLTVTDANGCSTTVTVVIGDFRFYFSRNPVTLEVMADFPEDKPNLSFLCELWVEKEYLSGEFEKVVAEPLEHPADSAGATVFDVRELPDAYVAPHLPGFNLNGVVRANEVFRRFYLKYTEKYGDPITVAPYTQVDTRYVICGGLDTPEMLTGTFFSSFLPNRKPFFTWDLPEKGVYADQPEFLYFLPNSFSLESFRVMVAVQFADGTTATMTAYTQTDVHRFELHCIPVGYAQLELGQMEPATKVKAWTVHVLDGQGNVVSETRRFQLLPDLGENRRYLLYTNSLGGINTLVATGKAKMKLDPDSVFLEKSLLPGSAYTQHEVEVRSKYGKVTLELSTGYREPREILALQDFLLAEKVWLVENDRYTPVVVLDRNHVPLDEAEDVGFLDFEVQLPRRHRYTPQLRLAGYLDQTAELKPLLP